MSVSRTALNALKNTTEKGSRNPSHKGIRRWPAETETNVTKKALEDHEPTQAKPNCDP